jgi:hypothetical protein
MDIHHETNGRNYSNEKRREQMNRNLMKNFKDGYEAFKRVDKRRIGGKSYFHVVANPMKKNTTPYREWQRGWEAGYFESLMKAAN